jgi:hypothetical protein
MPSYQPGDRVRVRSVREWAGQCYPARPVNCTYTETGGSLRSLVWFSEYDGWVGETLTVYTLATPENLPTIRGADGVLRLFHPDWLEPAESTAAALSCTCELTTLMLVGCRCGQIVRERAARG